MTHQNIMIDRIKTLIGNTKCDQQYCPFEDECNDDGDYCQEIMKWLNEQYI